MSKAELLPHNSNPHKTLVCIGPALHPNSIEFHVTGSQSGITDLQDVFYAKKESNGPIQCNHEPKQRIIFYHRNCDTKPASGHVQFKENSVNFRFKSSQQKTDSSHTVFLESKQMTIKAENSASEQRLITVINNV